MRTNASLLVVPNLTQKRYIIMSLKKNGILITPVEFATEAKIHMHAGGQIRVNDLSSRHEEESGTLYDTDLDTLAQTEIGKSPSFRVDLGLNKGGLSTILSRATWNVKGHCGNETVELVQFMDDAGQWIRANGEEFAAIDATEALEDPRIIVEYPWLESLYRLAELCEAGFFGTYVSEITGRKDVKRGVPVSLHQVRTGTARGRDGKLQDFGDFRIKFDASQIDDEAEADAEAEPDTEVEDAV